MENDTRERLRNRLNRMLFDRGLTEMAVAMRAGMDQGHFNRVKNGRVMPSLLTALRIAGALDVPVGSLFYLDGAHGDEP